MECTAIAHNCTGDNLYISRTSRFSSRRFVVHFYSPYFFFIFSLSLSYVLPAVCFSLSWKWHNDWCCERRLNNRCVLSTDRPTLVVFIKAFFLWLSFHNNCMRSKEIQNELFYVFFCFVIFPFSSFTLCVFQFSYFGFFSFRLFILFSSFIPSIDGHSRYDILTYQNGCLTIHEAKTAAYKKIASFMHTLAHSRISVFNEENRKEQKKKKTRAKNIVCVFITFENFVHSGNENRPTRASG